MDSRDDFALASKAMWAKRICTEINNDWKHVPKHYLKSVGKELVFSCNYDSKLVATIDCPPFYKTVLHAWQEIREIVPMEKSDIKDEIIWNNKFITVNKTSLYYKSWHGACVTKVSDLLNGSSFYTYEQFVEKYKIGTHFLQYYSLVNAIPSTWKKRILSVATTDEMSIKDRKKELLSNLTNKKAYNILISIEIKPPTSQIKILNMGISETDLPQLYLIPFTVTSETKLSMFQYKILHNILPTNSLLYKKRKK